MSPLNLRDELEDLARQVSPEVDALPADDPLKVWFEIELQEYISCTDDSQLNFEAANARLHALKHLRYLVQQRHILQHSRSSATQAENRGTPPAFHGLTPCQVQDSAGRLRFTMEPSLQYEPPRDHDQFDPVSPTAKIVGYLRGFDHSLNVHGATTYGEEGRRLLDALQIHDAQTRALMSVLFQSRYQAINALLAQGEPPQVIEFAAGISPRGLQWAGSSPGTIYVESDLPRLITHKARLIHNSLLSQSRQLKGFLHCCAADVLDHFSVQQCIAGLDDETSFAMVTEGLLLYFTEAEMRQLFRNLSVVLHQYPNSFWVTDLVTREHLQELFASSSSVGAAVRRVFSLTGRDVQPSNPFADTAEFMRWLAEFGLHVESSLALQKTTARLCFDVPVSAAQRDRIVGSRQIVRIRSSPAGPAA